MPVDRVDELLHVERGRGHLEQVGPAPAVVPAADEQRGHHRHQVADLHHREEDRAQAQRVALGRERAPDVGVGALAGAAAWAPQRLDRAGALDGLGQAVGEVGVGGALAQVARPAPGEVPRACRPAGSARRPAAAAPAAGPTTTIAPAMKTGVTNAMRISGTAKRTLCDSASTSREVRVSRSPVPARSTVDSGMARTRSTKSSRSSASTRSPSLAEASLANRISTACATTNPAMRQGDPVHRGRGRCRPGCRSTRRPSSHGRPRPATAARACSPSAMASSRGWRRSRRARSGGRRGCRRPAGRATRASRTMSWAASASVGRL